MNCLVRKLDVVIQNDNLTRVNALVYNNSDSVNNAHHHISIKYQTGVIGKVVSTGDLKFYSGLPVDGEGVVEYGNEHSTDENTGILTCYTNRVIGKVYITKRDSILELNDFYGRSLGLSEVGKCKNIQKATFYSSQGNIEDLSSCVNLTYLQVAFGSATGSVVTLAENMVNNGRTSGILDIETRSTSVTVPEGIDANRGVRITFDSSVSGGYTITQIR